MTKRQLILTILIGTIFSSPLFAKDFSASYNLSVEVVRINKLNNLIERINILHKIAEKYILETGDVNLTIDKIDNFYNIVKSNWINYNKNGYMQLVLENNNLIIKNAISPNELKEAKYIIDSRRLDSLGVVDFVKDNKEIKEINIVFPLSIKTISFIDMIKNKIPKEFPESVISLNAPNNTNLTWLKPDGNGNLIVLKNNNGQWKITGIYYIDKGFRDINSFNSFGGNQTSVYLPLIRIEKISELEGKIFPKGSLSIDINGNVYVTDGTGEWYSVNHN